jgi:predicted CXXCH cytochrome family protein
MERRHFLLIAALLLLFIPGPSTAAAPKCLDCHGDKKKHKVVHAALEMGCDSCHVGTHAGKKPAPKLTAKVPDLCYTCHDKDQILKARSHAPVADGMCTACHDPHGSGQPKLLVAAVPDLCFTCHSADTLGKKNVHASAAQGKCLTCHAPHSSASAYVLTQLVEEHCLSCHDDITDKHVLARVSPGDSHPLRGKPDPLRKGKDLACASCHNPHAEGQAKAVPLKSREPADICLRCHRKARMGP